MPPTLRRNASNSNLREAYLLSWPFTRQVRRRPLSPRSYVASLPAVYVTVVPSTEAAGGEMYAVHGRSDNDGSIARVGEQRIREGGPFHTRTVFRGLLDQPPSLALVPGIDEDEVTERLVRMSGGWTDDDRSTLVSHNDGNIRVIEKREDGWWIGLLRNHQGCFLESAVVDVSHSPRPSDGTPAASLADINAIGDELDQDNPPLARDQYNIPYN